MVIISDVRHSPIIRRARSSLRWSKPCAPPAETPPDASAQEHSPPHEAAVPPSRCASENETADPLRQWPTTLAAAARAASTFPPHAISITRPSNIRRLLAKFLTEIYRLSSIFTNRNQRRAQSSGASCSAAPPCTKRCSNSARRLSPARECLRTENPTSPARPSRHVRRP